MVSFLVQLQMGLLSSFLLLRFQVVYWNTWIFVHWLLYPVTVLYLFIASNSLLAESSGFSLYRIMSPAKSENFTSSSQFSCLLFLPLAQLLWLGLPVLCWITVAKQGNYCLVLLFLFHFWFYLLESFFPSLGKDLSILFTY